MFENEQYLGAHVTVPIAWFERVAAAALNHHQRLSRHVDVSTFEGTATAVSGWLDDLERARVMPTPSAEPGDLLVKVGRAETWTFTVHGWRELAPLELVGDPIGPGEPLWGERLADARRQRRDYGGFPGGIPHEPVFTGAGGACGRHGVYEGHICPDCVNERAARPRVAEKDFTATAPRFFGKSVVEEELDRLRAEKNAPAAAADPVPRNVRDALDELHQHADVLEDIAQALGDHPDGGNNSPHYEAIAQARTFARAIEYSRGIIWKHATRRQGSS